MTLPELSFEKPCKLCFGSETEELAPHHMANSYLLEISDMEANTCCRSMVWK